MKDDEKVLVIPEDDLYSIIGDNDVTPDPLLAERLIDHPRLEFRRRGDVEEDPSWKQLIPYVIMRRNFQVLIYTRHTSGGESRLHDKRSLGIGGHISEEDAQGEHSLYINGMYREIKEEVGLGPDDISRSYQADGIIYDPRNDVGKVHVGIIHFVDVKGNVWPKEDALDEMEFKSIMQIRQEYDRLETWSQLWLDTFFPVP